MTTHRRMIDNLCRQVLDEGQAVTHREDLLAAEVRRLQGLCGARHATNTSFIPCMLPADHDYRAPHWSTSGCAGGAVQWTDEESE